jgi:hypothetical protein
MCVLTPFVTAIAAIRRCAFVALVAAVSCQAEALVDALVDLPAYASGAETREAGVV